MAKHREGTTSLWVLPALAIPVVVAAVAWTAHVSSEGEEVAPNVRFAGIDISGQTPTDVAKHVYERENELLGTPIVVDLGERSVALTADEIGFDYLYEETVSSVVSARHSATPWSEFVAWVTTPLSTVTIDDHYVLDAEVARDWLSRADFVIEEPVEPSIEMDDVAQMYAQPGIDGVGIDIDRLIDDLAVADVANGAVEIEAIHVPIPPSVTDTEAEELASEMNQLTRSGFLALVGDHTARLAPRQIREQLVPSVGKGELAFALDFSGFREELEAGFGEVIEDLIHPEIEVADGDVTVVTPGRPPLVCCAESSIRTAVETYLDGGPSWYELEPRVSADERLVAWANGSLITEPVAEFTTYHGCCENRVVNIHTIADALTGKYLLPGETLSLNEFVGPRTRDKGYLPAGAIRRGHLTDEVGGGISQFVTTIFNAAFFAGLDLDEYQSHSVYFSRYPFGREATMSIPGPDLVLTNNTDYPVLIWPTYTDTSITVTLYSTPNVDVEELDHRVSYRNQCRHSEIDRQRTFSDGRVEIDTIVANYRPGDGIDCNGNPIPE